MIKILFFDAAGTLFHLPKGVGWHYRDVGLRHGWDLEEMTLQKVFGAVWREMPARPAQQMAREDEDKSWWRDLVERVLERCHPGRPDAMAREAYFEELYLEFTKPGVWELYPEVRAALDSLRERYRLGVISNFDGRLRHILGHLGIREYFAPLVISSEAGADKPDPWVFRRALSLAAVNPEEAAHVGDDPARDWEGAAAVGMHAFVLRRPENSLRDLDPWLKGIAG